MSGLWKTCCCDCVEGGKFVYASKSFEAFASPRWDQPPEVLNLLYRRVVAQITREMYYLDSGDGIWKPWHSVSVTIEIELDPYTHTGDSVKHVIVTGDDSGVLYEKTWNQGDCDFDTFILAYNDYTTLTDPNGDVWRPDAFPTGVTGGDHRSGFSVSDTSVACTFTEKSIDDQTIQVWSFENFYSQPCTPSTIGAEIVAMLATVPLSPLSTPNLITLSYDSCGELTTVTDTISDSDTACITGEARQQTFTPAALITDLPNSAGPAEDVDIDSFAINVYFYVTVVGDNTIPTLISPFLWDVSGSGKKALLQREDTDARTIFRPYDPETEEYGTPECLGVDVDTCRRFYFPDGADAGGTDAQNFTFGGDGIIYRSIPLDLGATPPCPTGTFPVEDPCEE